MGDVSLPISPGREKDIHPDVRSIRAYMLMPTAARLINLKYLVQHALFALLGAWLVVAMRNLVAMATDYIFALQAGSVEESLVDVRDFILTVNDQDVLMNVLEY
jgi:hypothetical protein